MAYRVAGRGRSARLAIYSTDEFSTLPDTYNTVQPTKPTITRRLRLVMAPRHNQTCVGLLAVGVDTRDD